MLRIGLTGGMGAGKSTAARLLTERGAVLIDSDVIAREVVAPGTEGLAALVEAFGSDILTADGSLDRPALAAKAFADDDARATLNGITHPLVGRRTAELLSAAPADAVVVQDVPLLVENGMGAMVNLVVVVAAETEVRVRRLEEFRGISRADASARIDAQASDEQRRAAADVLLDNNAEPEELALQIDALWEHRLVPFEYNLRTRTRAGRGGVELVDPDPTWQRQADRLIARLALACGDTARRIDHIGSTAVAGMPARDVLDLQITVADLAAADALCEALAEAGFPRLGYPVDDPAPATDPVVWGQRIHVNADPGRSANVHVRVEGWPNQQWALVFRDWLRAEPDAREEYLAVKRNALAAASGLTDDQAIQVYLDTKAPWFGEVRQRVLAARGAS